MYIADDGISIPCQYTSYIAPLSSSKLWNEARSCRDQNKPIEVRFPPYKAACIPCLFIYMLLSSVIIYLLYEIHLLLSIYFLLFVMLLLLLLLLDPKESYKMEIENE